MGFFVIAATTMVDAMSFQVLLLLGAITPGFSAMEATSTELWRPSVRLIPSRAAAAPPAWAVRPSGAAPAPAPAPPPGMVSAVSCTAPPSVSGSGVSVLDSADSTSDAPFSTKVESTTAGTLGRSPLAASSTSHGTFLHLVTRRIVVSSTGLK